MRLLDKGREKRKRSCARVTASGWSMEARVLWRRVDEVLMDAKIAANERVIISRLQSPVPGMKVREESEVPSYGK
ncbi:MAG: hypothetical protein D3903_16080, partial [Candidatus Electrothrix sp. GM3_4]|nr:hypothetical protein [Candidatus Electrothrix sp. GM3_4]